MGYKYSKLLYAASNGLGYLKYWCTRKRSTEWDSQKNINQTSMGVLTWPPTYSPAPEVWAHFLSMQTTAVLQADPTGCSNNRRWRRGILMTSRIPGWNKSHRKTLHDPVDLCKVLTHLRWGCFVARVCQTLTRCSQPSHSSGTFFSAVSLLTDVNYAENAAAMFLKAVDRNTLKNTDATLSDKGLPLWIKECCNVMLILASCHSIKCANCNRESIPFDSNSVGLCDGLMNFQRAMSCVCVTRHWSSQT